MNATAACMTGTHDARISLTEVTVDAVVRDLMVEVAMTQVYRNDEPHAIEALYTFPLPAAAVLLALDVTLGDRRLQAVVVEKKAAERRYEEAVSDGDSAIMLERPEPGTYTLNVGNLLPGEEARLTVRYALLQQWDRARLRLMIPTTIAPRYGASPLSPAQAPEHALTVENRFSLQVVIGGALADARVACPTHPVATQVTPDGLVLRLQAEQAVMDRDLVLEFHRDGVQRGCAWADRDGDGTAAIACFQPTLPAQAAPRVLDLVVVVDCSGSMNGNAIAQARKALAAMLSRLLPEDRLEIIAFGNRHRALFGGLRACTHETFTLASDFAFRLQADMGGTEISPALHAAFHAFEAGARGDVFLITDGEVSTWQPLVTQAAALGHRIFTVGVGSAVSEAFVRGLAEATGGACELVTPREGMAERVVRHFERLRTPRTRAVTLHWPEGARDAAPATPAAVFDGDTLACMARFATDSVTGEVRLDVAFEDGSQVSETLALMPLPRVDDAPHRSTTARIAAAQRLSHAPADTARATALDYGLISDWTNLLLVVARDAAVRSDAFPVLRKVPQTLAAGWGGVGDLTAFDDFPRHNLSMPIGGVARPLLQDVSHDDACMDDMEVGGDAEHFARLSMRIRDRIENRGRAETTPDGVDARVSSRAELSVPPQPPRTPPSPWSRLAPFLAQGPDFPLPTDASVEALLFAFEQMPSAGRSDVQECLRALLLHLRGSFVDVLRFDLVQAALAALLLQEILASRVTTGGLTRAQLRRFLRQRRALSSVAAACSRLRDPQATAATLLADPGLAALLGTAGITALTERDTRLSELRGMLEPLFLRAAGSPRASATTVAQDAPARAMQPLN